MNDKKFLESKKAWYFLLAAVFGLIGLGLGAYAGAEISDALTWYMLTLATVGGGGSVVQGVVDRARVTNHAPAGGQ